MIKTRKQDINGILLESKSKFNSIKIGYSKATDNISIDNSLLIEIKNYLENMRSILDYVAQDIPTSNKLQNKRIYFPILKSPKDFENKINGYFPGLAQINPPLHEFLEKIQPYNKGYAFLGEFNDVVNKYKHSHLVTQNRKRAKTISITANILDFSLRDNTLASRDSHDRFNKEKVSEIRTTISTDIKEELSIDFHFEKGSSAIELINRINQEIPIIIDGLYKLIK